MSRKSKAEYIGEKRRAYACASAAKRRQILDEVCETLCYTRKYVIKLMTGPMRRLPYRRIIRLSTRSIRSGFDMATSIPYSSGGISYPYG